MSEWTDEWVNESINSKITQSQQQEPPVRGRGGLCPHHDAVAEVQRLAEVDDLGLLHGGLKVVPAVQRFL
eukprot:scaffold576024_cov30-Prasinocladus_malaysianus.AAC.1